MDIIRSVADRPRIIFIVCDATRMSVNDPRARLCRFAMPLVLQIETKRAEALNIP